MANLKFSFPDIPERAIDVSSDADDFGDFSAYNSVRGARHTRHRHATTGTTLTTVYDLGAGVTRSCDHLIIARADYLQDLSVSSVVVARSSDGVSWTDQQTISTFSSQTLYGPREHDFVGTFTETSAYRYWRVRSTTGAATSHIHSKIYLGKFFEFNVEVEEYRIRRTFTEFEPFRATDGTQWTVRPVEPKYFVQFSWVGVTDAKATEFTDLIADSRKNQCFLYTTAVHEVLDDVRLLHCKPTRWNKEKIYPDWNVITVEFEELLG